MCRKMFLLAASFCVAATASAHAQQQAARPGLWESTTTIALGGDALAQLPPAMQERMRASGRMPGGQAIHTRACVTEEQIKKYLGPQPQTHGECTVTNQQIAAGHLSADISCTGEQLNGTGKLTGTLVDSGHTKLHGEFNGTMHGQSVTWTMDSSSDFLGASCGNIKPGESEVVH